jgi:tRNA threonylcarbamoyladenosine biosynthesis protein TsaB
MPDWIPPDAGGFVTYYVTNSATGNLPFGGSGAGAPPPVDACSAKAGGVSWRQMPSLRQLRADYASLLLIDAASSRVQVGWLTANGDRWQTSGEEAGVAVFRGTEELGVDLAAVTAFVFCEGPGSMLGIRTAAMALRTWNVLSLRPVFAYQSLAVLAHALGKTNVTVIADARRESWHAFRVGGKLHRLPVAGLSGALVTPEPFRNWSALPASVERVPYSVPELLAKTADEELFHATDAPDAFLHEEPSYVTWTPQIHRAP